MPDLMSHLLIGLILAELLNTKKKSLVVLGALMPDLISKIHLVYFYFGFPHSISFYNFHTPLMAFLLSVLIAPLFEYSSLRTVFYFNIGSISHFLSDLTMKHFTLTGTPLFFPFLRHGYTLNLVWPEQSIYILAATLAVYAVIKFTRKRGKS